jgi:hypothetical protein
MLKTIVHPFQRRRRLEEEKRKKCSPFIKKREVGIGEEKNSPIAK